MSSNCSSMSSKFTKKDKEKKESKKVKDKKRDSKKVGKGAITVAFDQNGNENPKKRSRGLRFKSRKSKKTDGSLSEDSAYSSTSTGSEALLQEANGFMKPLASELAMSHEKIELDVHKKNAMFKLQDALPKYDQEVQEIDSAASSNVVQANFLEDGGVNETVAEETDINEPSSKESKVDNEEQLKNVSLNGEEDSRVLSQESERTFERACKVHLIIPEEKVDTAMSTGISSTGDITAEREETDIGTLNEEDVEEPFSSTDKKTNIPQENGSPDGKAENEPASMKQEIKSVEEPERQLMAEEKELQQDDAVNDENVLEQGVTDKTEIINTMIEEDASVSFLEKSGQAALLQSVHGFQVALEDFKVNQQRRNTYSDEFENEPASMNQEIKSVEEPERQLMAEEKELQQDDAELDKSHLEEPLKSSSDYGERLKRIEASITKKMRSMTTLFWCCSRY